MIRTIKNLLTNKAPLKAISLILGYTTWYLLGTIHQQTIWKTIPLSFYNTDAHSIIEAPETVKVLLSGTRAHLRTIQQNTLAAYIDGEYLKKGKQVITLSTDQLFLPNSIKLIHYIPTTIAITVKKIET